MQFKQSDWGRVNRVLNVQNWSHYNTYKLNGECKVKRNIEDLYWFPQFTGFCLAMGIKIWSWPSQARDKILV